MESVSGRPGSGSMGGVLATLTLPHAQQAVLGPVHSGLGPPAVSSDPTVLMPVSSQAPVLIGGCCLCNDRALGHDLGSPRDHAAPGANPRRALRVLGV